jgi:hypothetical protein
MGLMEPWLQYKNETQADLFHFMDFEIFKGVFEILLPRVYLSRWKGRVVVDPTNGSLRVIFSGRGLFHTKEGV